MNAYTQVPHSAQQHVDYAVEDLAADQIVRSEVPTEEINHFLRRLGTTDPNVIHTAILKGWEWQLYDAQEAIWWLARCGYIPDAKVDDPTAWMMAYTVIQRAGAPYMLPDASNEEAA